MNPDFEKIKNVLAVIRRVFLSVCALVITLGVLILLRSLINAEFLRSYNSGRYSSIPENLLPYLPFGENYVAPYNLGNVEYQRGNYDKAIYYYALAYQNGPPEHPEHDEECRIRVNLALSMCHTIDFDNLDYSDAEAVAEAMVTLQQARAILTEAECASEPVGSDDGHYRDADKLKHDIDKMLEQLQSQSDSNEGGRNGGGGQDENQDGGDGQNEDQNQDDGGSGQDKKDSQSQKEEEQRVKEEQARQEKLKEDLRQQKEDLKDGSGSSSYNYEYIDGGDAQGYGEGTLW